jgi:hypothetical protein
MARTFENPSNLHRETVGGSDSIGVFFLGMFYLMYKGLWGQVLIWSLLVIAPTVAFSPLIIFALPTASIAYAIGIQEILAKSYLNKGWREVKDSNSESIVDRAATAPTQPTAASDTKLCPYCAEEVKAAAIRCKHCQSDLPPSDGRVGASASA